MYNLSDFSYHLPPELIAQKPARPRDHSRLLLLNKKNGAIEHRYFYNILAYLRPGDLLVLNNSKVFPARLLGHKTATGGAVEVFLHHPLRGQIWECLIGGRVKEGLLIDFPKGLQARVGQDNNDGTWQVRFNLSGEKFWRTIYKIGLVPLPPYIKRNRQIKSDKSSYQTVFADDRKIGSVAAPTAGLHFTRRLLKKIQKRGVNIEYITLHVGLGTFASVKTKDIRNHKMHRELADVSARTIRSIIKTKQAGRRVVAVGTTTCRTLESLDLSQFIRIGDKPGQPITRQSFWTDIFIYPGYRFKTIDALLTNFHLSRLLSRPN